MGSIQLDVTSFFFFLLFYIFLVCVAYTVGKEKKEDISLGVHHIIRCSSSSKRYDIMTYLLWKDELVLLSTQYNTVTSHSAANGGTDHIHTYKLISFSTQSALNTFRHNYSSCWLCPREMDVCSCVCFGKLVI